MRFSALCFLLSAFCASGQLVLPWATTKQSTATSITLGTGTNAVTISATGAGVVTGSNLSWIVDGVTAQRVTLGGVVKTGWPEFGTASSAGSVILDTTFSTNYATVSGLTNFGYFTNGYYSATWISTNGDSLTIVTSTNGVTWEESSPSTNAQYLGMIVTLGNLAGGTPAVSNLVIQSFRSLAAFNGTNDFRTTHVLLDAPVTGVEAANKTYVDNVAYAAPANWSAWRAASAVNLNGKTVTASPDFTWGTGSDTNQPSYVLNAGGSNLVSYYASSGGTNAIYSLTMVVSGTNLVFTAPQNLTATMPTIQANTNLSTGAGWVNATVLTNYVTNLLFTVVIPGPATSPTLYRAKITSGPFNPAKVEMAAILTVNGLGSEFTNTLTFSGVSSFTNTLGYDATALITAGSSVAIQNSAGNSIGSVGIIGGMGATVPLRKNYRITGTGVSAVLY